MAGDSFTALMHVPQVPRHSAASHERDLDGRLNSLCATGVIGALDGSRSEPKSPHRGTVVLQIDRFDVCECVSVCGDA